MNKLIVFYTGDFMDTAKEMRRMGGEEVTRYAKYISSDGEIRGFADAKYVALRGMTDYEQQYAAEHNITMITDEELQAMRLELEAAALAHRLADFTNDELIIELENRDRVNKYHTANITLGEFSMKHTLRCHPDLFSCDIHAKLLQAFNDNGGLAPMPEGLYRLWWQDETHTKLDMVQLKPPGVDAPAVMSDQIKEGSKNL